MKNFVKAAAIGVAVLFSYSLSISLNGLELTQAAHGQAVPSIKTQGHWYPHSSHRGPGKFNNYGIELQGVPMRRANLWYSRGRAFNHVGQDVYIRFFVSTNNRYVGFHLNPGNLPKKHYTTQRSWGGSKLIPNRQWLYQRSTVLPDGRWTVTVARNNYDNRGGQVLHKQSGKLNGGQLNAMKRMQYMFGYNDTYAAHATRLYVRELYSRPAAGAKPAAKVVNSMAGQFCLQAVGRKSFVGASGKSVMTNKTACGGGELVKIFDENGGKLVGGDRVRLYVPGGYLRQQGNTFNLNTNNLNQAGVYIIHNFPNKTGQAIGANSLVSFKTRNTFFVAQPNSAAITLSTSPNQYAQFKLMMQRDVLKAAQAAKTKEVAAKADPHFNTAKANLGKMLNQLRNTGEVKGVFWIKAPGRSGTMESKDGKTILTGATDAGKGNFAISRETFNHLKAESYQVFRTHGAAHYQAVHAYPRSVPQKYYSTGNSWKGSVVLKNGVWYYQRTKVDHAGRWEVILAENNFDVAGGKVVSKQSGTLTAGQKTAVQKTQFTTGYNDHRSAPGSYVEIAGAYVHFPKGPQIRVAPPTYVEHGLPFEVTVSGQSPIGLKQLIVQYAGKTYQQAASGTQDGKIFKIEKADTNHSEFRAWVMDVNGTRADSGVQRMKIQAANVPPVIHGIVHPKSISVYSQFDLPIQVSDDKGLAKVHVTWLGQTKEFPAKMVKQGAKLLPNVVKLASQAPGTYEVAVVAEDIRGVKSPMAKSKLTIQQPKYYWHKVRKGGQVPNMIGYGSPKSVLCASPDGLPGYMRPNNKCLVVPMEKRHGVEMAEFDVLVINPKFVTQTGWQSLQVNKAAPAGSLTLKGKHGNLVVCMPNLPQAIGWGYIDPRKNMIRSGRGMIHPNKGSAALNANYQLCRTSINSHAQRLQIHHGIFAYAVIQ